MVVWNGMLEKQNITLEKQLVASHGELAALRQSLTRSNAEAQQYQRMSHETTQQLQWMEKKRLKRLKRDKKRKHNPDDNDNDNDSLIINDVDVSSSAISLMNVADEEIRSSMTKQIELLEAEKVSLTRELKSQAMVIHNLTNYQDNEGDEF